MTTYPHPPHTPPHPTCWSIQPTKVMIMTPDDALVRQVQYKIELGLLIDIGSVFPYIWKYSLISSHYEKRATTHSCVV